MKKRILSFTVSLQSFVFSTFYNFENQIIQEIHLEHNQLSNKVLATRETNHHSVRLR